jgi:hypothetical protein
MKEFIEVPASKMSLSKRKLVLSVGINDANYKTYGILNNKKTRCPYYSAWVDMLTRCYSASFHKRSPTYIGCTVVSFWLTFSNFKLWMETQDWKNKQLDKDILVIGNKVYSPETCIFVQPELNGLLSIRANSRGEYKQGVWWDSSLNKFRACISLSGKTKQLGCFNTEEAASNTYRAFKYNHIAEIANTQIDTRLRTALLNHANQYL